MAQDDGGPIFSKRSVATETGPRYGGAAGMSPRDYFAAAALAGMLSAEAHPSSGGTLCLDARLWGIGAYKFADAMLAERAKRAGEEAAASKWPVGHCVNCRSHVELIICTECRDRYRARLEKLNEECIANVPLVQAAKRWHRIGQDMGIWTRHSDMEQAIYCLVAAVEALSADEAKQQEAER